MKKTLSVLTALFIILNSLFSLSVFAAGIGEDNISRGSFNLECSDKQATYYDVSETTASDGTKSGLVLKMTEYSEKRANIINYKNQNGEPAKFVHTRFMIGCIKGSAGNPQIKDELRLIHLVGSDEILRFNINASDKIGIFGGEDKLRGYSLEYTWKMSTEDQPFYNKADIIEDCENGAIYLFINGRLNAYSTDGSTDGKFYGYVISKNENCWEDGDVLSVGFEDGRIGHTVFKDTSSHKVTLEEVLQDAGIEEGAYSPYKKDITSNINYVQSGGMYKHKQTDPYLVTGPGSCIQLEEGSYTDDYSLVTDRDAADIKCLKSVTATNSKDPAAADAPELELKFSVEESAVYAVYIRYFAPNKSSDSIYWAFGDNSYKNQDLNEEAYTWMKLYNGRMNPGEVYKVRIRHRENGHSLDCLLVSRVPGHTPSGRYGGLPESLEMKVDPLDPDYFDDPPILPPAHTHPRVLFTPDDIPRIKANMESPLNAAVMEEYRDQLDSELNTDPDGYSTTQMGRIECYALEYALNKDAVRGRQAKAAILATVKNVSFSDPGIEQSVRPAGHVIHVAAKVYDWCYDLFNADEREQLIVGCVALSNVMEMTWPPKGQGTFADHGAEAQLLRDYLSLAIAVYDERPDFWDYIGGRYFSKYIPIRQTFTTNLFAGSDYGTYRQMWISYSYALIKGMGYDIPIDKNRLYEDDLWTVYYRRPDGQLFRNGDISFGDKTPMWDFWQVYVPCYLLDQYLTGNPYIKYEYARMTPKMDAWNENRQNYTSLVDVIIMNDATLEPAKSFEGLPYSKYLGSPYGIMLARTGWDDGADSPTVAAEMKVQEWQANGHMHLDAGHFQIYYKGILASDSGVYQGAVNSTSGTGATAFGSVHFNQYETKTVAHNCMLVYDPSEADKSSDLRRAINDGGQRSVNNGNDLGAGILDTEDSHVAKVDGVEIDPENPMRPAYSYLKGDLTNAYSKKVSDYKRSFMFLNLDRSDVPAALIVFDKIDSSSAAFKKTWLLHGLEEPEIKGNQTVFKRTYKSTVKANGYNGKLTLDTVLPKEAVIDKVGGDEMGWSTVNGRDYTGYPFKTQTDEGQTWRIELSPKTKSESDLFLNVMQVSDADKENYLPVEEITSNLFSGVKISDRVVAFSNSGKRVGGEFSLSVPGSGECHYTICDIEKGTYSINAGGKELKASASDEGGVLSFKAPAGNITVKKISDEAETAPAPELPEYKEAPGTVSVKQDKAYIYLKDGVKNENGTVMASADDISRRLQSRIEKGADTVTLSNKGNNVTFTNGSYTLIVNGVEKALNSPAALRDGIMYIPLRAAVESLGGTVDWDGCANTVIITSPPADLSLPDGYVRIIAGADDGGTIDKNNTYEKMYDEDASTIWSTNGKDRYVTFELEKPSDIDGVDIMFNPNSGRDARFTIAVSEDGKIFTDIYSDHGDGAVEGGAWEHFGFSPQTNIKFVRYFGNGSNISNWNAVKEIRIKKYQ